jgi:phenylacetate-coenzyme A ligase PaaK-like adenylate-forming protein
MDSEQFSVPRAEKAPLMLDALNELTAHHRAHGEPYRRMLDALGDDGTPATSLDAVPHLPVSMFKWLELSSIDQDDVFKVLRSSGTTGQVPSTIVLDVDPARLQTRALSTIVQHYVGPKRLPMLVVDHPGVIKDRRNITARGAGILGMMSYGRDHQYLLDDDLQVDVDGLQAWLTKHEGEDLLLFGFTFMVWQHLYGQLRDAGVDVDLSRAVLVHSGGWKKLIEQSVTNEVFKASLRDAFGMTRVHNFYGMVEQVGSVFFECPAGFLHPPNFADVLIRDPRTWEPAAVGEPGVVEVLSLLPRSYPGHALLTEDTGTVHGVDDCPCGRMGSRFSFSGRVPKAEIRGCSDVIAAGASARG